MKHLLNLNLLGEITTISCVLFFLGEPFIRPDVIAFSILAWFVGTFLTENYYINRLSGVLIHIIRLIKFLSVYYILVSLYITLFHTNELSKNELVIFFMLLFGSLTAWRIFLFFIIKRAIKYDKNRRKLVIIGISDESVHLKNFINKKPQYGLVVEGFFSDETSDRENVIGNYEDVIEYCKKNKITDIICSLKKLDKDYLLNLIDFAENHFISIRIIPDTSSILGRNMITTFLENIPLLTLRDKPFEKGDNVFIKRFFDVLFSLCVILCVFSWLFPIISILILLDSKGPVFFSQERSGLRNKSFKCLKFRSMVVNNDANTSQAQRNDPRITKIGAFLRKTSLDELPQFFNVLWGDMSVVGPRPHMIKHTEQYTKLIDKYMFRHLVKPGITGLSQVMGYRGETQHDVHLMKMRVRMDRFYIENWSFYLDIKIIYSTILSIIKPGNNVY